MNPWFSLTIKFKIIALMWNSIIYMLIENSICIPQIYAIGGVLFIAILFIAWFYVLYEYVRDEWPRLNVKINIKGALFVNKNYILWM